MGMLLALTSVELWTYLSKYMSSSRPLRAPFLLRNRFETSFHNGKYRLLPCVIDGGVAYAWASSEAKILEPSPPQAMPLLWWQWARLSGVPLQARRGDSPQEGRRRK